MELMKIFHKVELEGGQATLSATTHEGKTKLKLEIVSPPSATAPPSSPPAPGRRRRHRGARARARRNQRAAAHQTEAAASAPLAPPLRLLPSPPPDSGRRQVLSCGERLPSFSNLDGAPPLLLLPHQHQHHLHLCPLRVFPPQGPAEGGALQQIWRGHCLPSIHYCLLSMW